MIPFSEFKNRFTTFENGPMAEGGQKIVYSAVHPKYGDVVVKLLFHKDARAEREINILLNEALLHVPHLYEVADVDVDGKDTTVLVEQRIKGTMLRDRIRAGAKYNLGQAVDFLEQALKFIDEISQREIVHRDLKPENIIQTNSGEYYFLDFGIARILDAVSLTATSQGGIGTIGYCAPEQFTNQKDRIDTRADLFSIGVVTYELITGKNPFREDASSILAVLYNTATVIPTQYALSGDTQSQFMGLLSALMSRSIIGRPKNAGEALKWLEVAKSTFIM